MLEQIVLVAVLTLPNSSAIVQEAQGRYQTMQECERGRTKALTVPDRYRKSLVCLPVDPD